MGRTYCEESEWGVFHYIVKVRDLVFKLSLYMGTKC